MSLAKPFDRVRERAGGLLGISLTLLLLGAGYGLGRFTVRSRAGLNKAFP